jgi:Mn-dependent DtxR family transcriptional regulator
VSRSPGAWHSLNELSLKRAWGTGAQALARPIARARRAGLVRTDGGALAARVALTPEGEQEARAIVRAHRLWELYLIDQADIPPDHVDRDADAIEHVLPRDVLERLEERLRQQGRLPGSPHELPRPIAGGAGVKP